VEHEAVIGGVEVVTVLAEVGSAQVELNVAQASLTREDHDGVAIVGPPSAATSSRVQDLDAASVSAAKRPRREALALPDER
jgi:hypothetical protein